MPSKEVNLMSLQNLIHRATLKNLKRKKKNHNSIAFKAIDMISPFTFLKLLTHCSTRGLTNPDVTTRATPNEENRALMITQPSSNAHT